MKTGERRYPVHLRKVPRTWWLQTPPFRRFAAREFTSVFVAAFSVILLLFLFALSRGPEDYEGFLRWLGLPGTVVVHAVILAAVAYHAVTWLRLTAHVQVVRLGRRTVPRDLVTAGLFVAWGVASAVAAYLAVWL